MHTAPDPVPWFKIATLDVLAKCTGRPLAYQVAYFMAHALIALYRRPLPDDIASLTRLMGLAEPDEQCVQHALVDSFELTPNGWINDLMAEAIARSDELRDARREAGSRGGKTSSSKSQANLKQNRSKTEAKPKQRRSNAVATPKAKPKEEVEEELDTEVERDSVFVPKTAGNAALAAKDQLWAEALPALMGQGRTEPASRSLVGKLERDFGTAQVLYLFREAIEHNATDLPSYVTANGKPLAKTAAAQLKPTRRSLQLAREQGVENPWEAMNVEAEK